MLSKGVSSTIFKVFGMMRPGIEPRSPGPLVNTLPKHILLITFLNESELIFFAQLNGFKYFYQVEIILFTINYLFAHS